jgi:hypothetical protein
MQNHEARLRTTSNPFRMRNSVLLTFFSTNQAFPDSAKVDGLLVRVRARAVVGWEGDDFLYDPTEQAGGKAPGRAGAVWFYCNAENGRLVYAAIDRRNSFTTATFTGYFHFVPDPKNRGKHMFDPGRLQVEVVGVSDVAKSQTPWVSTGR